MNISERTKKLLTLSRLKGVGAVTLRKLIANSNVLEDKIEEIVKSSFKPLKLNNSDIASALEFAESQAQKAIELGHKITSYGEPDYPELLYGLDDYPPILFIAGNVKAMSKKAITVIGTRQPTEDGSVIAKRVTSWFCDRGWNIVSGLAIGIDQIAHETSLAHNSQTVAVLAHGLEKIYPKKNTELAEKILKEGGTWVSEYSYGTNVNPARLVQRDKIQAALGAGVMLVQSGLEGGSLHASRHILKYKRPLIVVGQSKNDWLLSSEKAQANFLLLGNNEEKIAKLLKLRTLRDSVIIKLHSKLQYSQAERGLESILPSSNKEEAQGLLLD